MGREEVEVVSGQVEKNVSEWRDLAGGWELCADSLI